MIKPDEKIIVDLHVLTFEAIWKIIKENKKNIYEIKDDIQGNTLFDIK